MFLESVAEIMAGDSVTGCFADIASPMQSEIVSSRLHINNFPFLLSYIPLFFSSSSASSVLLKFRTDKSRDPDPQSFPEDSELLKQIRDDVLAAMKVNSDLLSDEFIRYKSIWCVVHAIRKWTYWLMLSATRVMLLHITSHKQNGASPGGKERLFESYGTTLTLL